MVELESKFLYWWSDMRASATEATIVMLCRAAFHAGYHAAQQSRAVDAAYACEDCGSVDPQVHYSNCPRANTRRN